MIGYDQALAICRTDPESAARMLRELSRELDALRKEVAALKAENAALRAECQTLRNRVRTLEEQVAKNSHNSHLPAPLRSAAGRQAALLRRAGQAQEPAPEKRAAHRRSTGPSGAYVADGREPGPNRAPSSRALFGLRAIHGRAATGPRRAPPGPRPARTEARSRRASGRGQDLPMRLREPRGLPARSGGARAVRAARQKRGRLSGRIPTAALRPARRDHARPLRLRELQRRHAGQLQGRLFPAAGAGRGGDPRRGGRRSRGRLRRNGCARHRLAALAAHRLHAAADLVLRAQAAGSGSRRSGPRRRSTTCRPSRNSTTTSRSAICA